MGFDKWYEDPQTEDFPSLYQAFNAGAASRQAEIDELKKKYDAMYKAFTVSDDARKEWHRCYMGIRQREDELQKRIDKALIEINIYYDSDGMEDICLYDIGDILKGKKDE